MLLMSSSSSQPRLSRIPERRPHRAQDGGDAHGKDVTEGVELLVRGGRQKCRAGGWGARSVIGHPEWQPGESDRRAW